MQPKDIADNYTESFDFLYDRKRRQVNQLVLLNNLQRGDETIASTMLLTLFNRILSNLYDDKLQIKFIPSEELDQRQIDSMNILAQNDYREMNKAKLDYDWAWDTLFFGTGWVETLRFDTKRKIMEPHVINPLVFGYDPYFENIQDWRYYWKWVTKNKWELQKLITDGTITLIKDVKEIPSGVDPYLLDFKTKRDAAKKANAMSTDTVSDDIFQILEYYAYDENGNKCVYWIDRGFSKIIWKKELDLKDAPDGKGSLWPIVKKEAFREPHSSVVFSIADLLEDKHRAKSVLLNLAFIAAKDKANPIYWYDPTKIKDVTSFFSRQINQHIATDGPGGDAVGPLNTQEPMSAGLIQFISMLTQEANDPVGTGMSMNPIKKGKTTATDSAIQQQLNDLAQSLQSKVMQFGEQDFWSHWFHRYARYTGKDDQKIATITGVKGMNFEKINLGETFGMKFPPGVLVYSAKEAEYKELVLRRDFMQMYPQFQETLGPEGMRNFNKHVFFPKFLQDPSLIDVMIPDSMDEIKAKDENELLAQNKLPDVLETDDHLQHIYIHHMAKPKTWSVWAHLAWHEELLAKQKKDQMEQQKAGQENNPDDTMGDNKDSKKPKPAKIGEKKKSPQEAVSPLKDEIKTKNTIK